MDDDWNSPKQSHPTKDIQGIESDRLKGKTICLCLTGSVAVINAPHVARKLMRQGAEIICAMTQAATDLVQPEMMEWSTGNKVILTISGQIEHIAIAGERENTKGLADMVVIYPASANTIGKIAHGISDTAVTAISMVALGSKTPLVVVPAMHESMFQNPIVKNNMKHLQSFGIHLLGPRLEENKAKVAEPEEVSSFVENYFQSSGSGLKKLNGKKFLLTAGPTREWIDNVRFLSNPSSGKMGIALAQAILSSGAEVCLLLGPTNIQPMPHPNLRVHHPVNTADFVQIMEQELDQTPYDVLISTAALADFTPKERLDKKISSNNQEITLNLISTPKLIKRARQKTESLFIVGFKAESMVDDQEMISKAYQRLQDSQLNLIIANKVHPSLPKQGFGADKNEVYIIDPQKETIHLPLASKDLIAQQILEKIIDEMKK